MSFVAWMSITACGVSGRSDSGYLSGNGLLAAVTLGRIAGRDSADAP